ncbi:phage tail fiber protein [Klebsiella pneumoniae]
MTVSTQVSRNEYTGNGATTQYDFTFRILDKSHLLVQTLDTSESIVTLTLGTDYTVTGVNRYNGGKVVLTSALPAGYKISIERSIPVTQEASIRNQGGFFPEIHEDAFDKLTMIIQRMYGWWSGLALKKPSWLANYYDAQNNRIRNLRDPSQEQDAATKNYVDSQIVDNTNAWQEGDRVLDQKIDENLSRSLRVPESIVSQLYPVSGRRDSILGFNSEGNPVPIFSMTETADLAVKLASSDTGLGDELLAVKQPYPGAVARTQHSKNWEQLNLLDFVYDTDIVDGVIDYGLGLNRAIAAMASLGSTSVEHIPRRRINLPAGLLHIKTKVELSFGPFAMCGEGIYQTIFTIHPSAESDDDYLFDFSSAGWDATGRVRISELYLSNFSVLGETADWIRKKIFNFYGVGWDFAVENVQVWSPPLSAFDMTDTMDGVFNQVRINSGGRFLTAGSEVTHQINMLNQYDNCNAIRYMSCHFENNYSGVSYIRGGSNNILFGGMCKFENNSRNNLVPVNQIYGSTSDSVKFENIFVSHPAHITVYWLDSNGRHVSIRGGSLMSPSDLSGYTGLRWFRIHRTNWASATACVQLVADIDMMHVDGYGYNGANQLSPFDFEGEVIFRAKAIRLARPNTFMYINWNCKIDIENLTLLGAVTSDYQTSLFNVAASSVKADVNVDKYNGSVVGTVYVNPAMTTASRRQSIINVRGKSLQSSSLTLSEGTDPLGYDESWTWNASGNVANIGYCHTGKRMVVRCADTSNCLIAGGNIFLPGGAVTAACTITLMAMNTSFRQGWVEVSRVAGV